MLRQRLAAARAVGAAAAARAVAGARVHVARVRAAAPGAPLPRAGAVALAAMRRRRRRQDELLHQRRCRLPPHCPRRAARPRSHCRPSRTCCQRHSWRRPSRHRSPQDRSPPKQRRRRHRLVGRPSGNVKSAAAAAPRARWGRAARAGPQHQHRPLLRRKQPLPVPLYRLARSWRVLVAQEQRRRRGVPVMAAEQVDVS